MKIINEVNILVQLYSWLAGDDFYCLLTTSRSGLMKISGLIRIQNV